MKNIKGTYVGVVKALQDETALLRYDGDDVLAQFDNIRLKYHGRGMGFNWHRFPKSDFDIKEVKDDGSSCRLVNLGG